MEIFGLAKDLIVGGIKDVLAGKEKPLEDVDKNDKPKENKGIVGNALNTIKNKFNKGRITSNIKNSLIYNLKPVEFMDFKANIGATNG